MSRFAELNLDPALAESAEGAPGDALLEGIVRLNDPSDVPSGFAVVSLFDRICTGRFRATDTWAIRSHPNVMSLKAARPLGLHSPETTVDVDLLPSPRWANGSSIAERPAYTGRGVVVAALDFGLDFAHPNFLDDQGRTRLIAFWHQGAPYDRQRPNRFGYGRIFSRAEVNAALRASDPYDALGYHPAISDTGSGCHGTHTLDIAAGNGRARGAAPGLASDSELVFVHLSAPQLGTVGDLGDSVRLLEALDFVEKRAAHRPCVINVSLGRTAGPHDGTSLVEQGMHEFLRKGRGRAIVQSAGNYFASDLAAHGRLRDGQCEDLEWVIDPSDTTGNQMDAWYSGKDRFRVAIRAPAHEDFVEADLGEMKTITHGGREIGRIYHRRHDPNNHDNHVEVFLEPDAPSGIWTIRLIGDFVINGVFHAWIERDLARPGAQSRFLHRITSNLFTLGSIATSPLVITVGAYDSSREDRAPARFSSSGPTRDGRDKPEVLAPGVDVLAARSIPWGATRQEGLLVARSGTSMAAPHVTGTVAAMFEAAGAVVSIEVIRACLQSSAEPWATRGHAHRSAWGRLDPVLAIQAVVAWRQTRGVGQTGLGPPVSLHNGTALSPAESIDSEEPSGWTAHKGGTMSRVLDRIEGLLPQVAREPRYSERLFLQQLLQYLRPEFSGVQLTPAELSIVIAQNGGLDPDLSSALEVLAGPGQQLLVSLQPGDWIVRRIPGTGDVGHVAVASSDLITQATLAARGVSAESAQPGYYATVIEAGVFPHDRWRPFARRVLDRRGRVLRHNWVLRPRWAREDEPLNDRTITVPNLTPQREDLRAPQDEPRSDDDGEEYCSACGRAFVGTPALEDDSHEAEEDNNQFARGQDIRFWPTEDVDTDAGAVASIGLPAGFRLGVWLDVGGRSLVSHADEHSARLRELAITDGCIMINRVDDEQFRFGAVSEEAIRTFLGHMTEGEFRTTLTSWLRPDRAFIDELVRVLPAFAQSIGARGIEFDVEEPWSRRRPTGFPDHDAAARYLYESLASARAAGLEIAVTCQVDALTSSRMRAIVQGADVIPQAYSTYKKGQSSHAVGGTYGPRGLQDRAVAKVATAVGPGQKIIMGLAAYGRDGWPGLSARDVMELELAHTSTLAQSAGVRGVRYWSWKHIAGLDARGGRPANRYALRFLRDVASNVTTTPRVHGRETEPRQVPPERVAPPTGSPDRASEPGRDWMQVSGDERMRYVMDLLVSTHNYPVHGAAGIVGNLWMESAVLPNRVEGSRSSTPMRARNFDDVQQDFTAEQIMNRDSAARWGPKKAGIGLAQWTSRARRRGLFQHTFRNQIVGAPILFDMDAQVDYLVSELASHFRSVDQILRSSSVSLETASDEFVYSFEVPGSILSITTPRRKLPRSDEAVLHVFNQRRAASQRALRAYSPGTERAPLRQEEAMAVA